MNKKAQEADIMKIIGLFISILLVIWMLSFVSQAFHNSTCESEIKQINSLTNDRDDWKNYALSLNNTINNCTNLIQEQIDTCDTKINNSVENCQDKIIFYEDFIITNNIFITIHYIFVFVFYFPLSFNLFKIVVNVGLSKEWEKRIGFWKKTWLVTKITCWIILTLGFILYLLLMWNIKPL